MEPLPEKDGMKRFYPSLKIIPQTLDRTFSNRWRTFWKTPWCFDENSLTNSWVRLGALKSLPWRIILFVKTCKYGVFVLSSKITYTSATEVRTPENQCVPVSDVLKTICHICHGGVADDHCPLQMVCHHSPLIPCMICFRCSVAVVVANVLL